MALFWAKCLSEQEEDVALAKEFKSLYDTFYEHQSTILNELNSAQGSSVDIGGYYAMDDKLTTQNVRRSCLFNKVLKDY